MRKIERYLSQFAGGVVLILAWVILHTVKRKLLKQNIWLICEKRNEARDNGYHLFQYLRKHHPEINSYYVITSDSEDLHKVESLGNIIISDSWKHCLYFLAATRSISSQAYGAYPFGFNLKEIRIIQRLTNKEQKTIFLQHGITKDELGHSYFDYSKNNIDYFVTSAKREYDFVKTLYGYPDHAIGCIGMCRFDNLLNNNTKKEKIVLVMPTWRGWLQRSKSGEELTEKEIIAFSSSEYYNAYKELLTDSRFITKLRERGYKIYFYLHYQMQDYSQLFLDLQSESVVIADRQHFDVQDLLIRASVLITDYSSVYFDFAYMNKPEAFYQFDYEKFVSNHYAKGYFDYEKDAFGPCFKEESDIVDYLCQLIDCECKQPDVFEKRANDFFNIRDCHNCERTYKAIMDL